jgi:hypothetical protein
MGVPGRYTWNRMSEQASSSQFRKPHFRGCRSKGVTEYMGCSHPVQPRFCAHSLQHLRHADEVAFALAPRGIPQGQSFGIRWQSTSFTASAPIGRICGPLFVSWKRMHRVGCASASVRRNPEWMAANAVLFFPTASLRASPAKRSMARDQDAE